MEVISQNVIAIVLALTPVTSGIVQIFKITGLSSRWAGLASLLVGVGLFQLLSGGLTWQWSVLGGILVGLSASGLYSAGRATIEG